MTTRDHVPALVLAAVALAGPAQLQLSKGGVAEDSLQSVIGLLGQEVLPNSTETQGHTCAVVKNCEMRQILTSGV